MEEEYDKAEAYVMRLLGMRSQSIAEVERKLTRKQFSREVIMKLIADMRGRGLLNDHRFTLELVQSLIRRKEVGKFYIQNKLREHGVDDSISNDILEKELSPQKELELAQNAANRKKQEFSLKINKLSADQKAKIARFLSSRGFSGELIREVIDEIGG